MFCPSCGASVPPESRFCGSCGCALPAPPPDIPSDASPSPAVPQSEPPPPQPPEAESHLSVIFKLLASPIMVALVALVTLVSLPVVYNTLISLWASFDLDTWEWILEEVSDFEIISIILQMAALALRILAVVLCVIGLWLLYYGSRSHSRRAVEGASWLEKGLLTLFLPYMITFCLGVAKIVYVALAFHINPLKGAVSSYIGFLVAYILIFSLCLSLYYFVRDVRRALSATNSAITVNGSAAAVLCFVLAGLLLIGLVMMIVSSGGYFSFTVLSIGSFIAVLCLTGVFILTYRRDLTAALKAPTYPAYY